MAKYRKKPVVIDAFQITDAMFDDGFWEAECGLDWDPVSRQVAIKTLEGTMMGDVGDWIITGIKGEKYPCKPDIFEATYELVVDELGGD